MSDMFYSIKVHVRAAITKAGIILKYGYRYIDRSYLLQKSTVIQYWRSTMVRSVHYVILKGTPLLEHLHR